MGFDGTNGGVATRREMYVWETGGFLFVSPTGSPPSPNSFFILFYPLFVPAFREA